MTEPLDWLMTEGLLPSQWQDSLRGQPAEPGILRLIREVLESALRDLEYRDSAMHSHHGEKLWKAAWYWIIDDEVRPFSFIWCCEALDIDPQRTRQALAARPVHLSRRSPVWQTDHVVVRRER